MAVADDTEPTSAAMPASTVPEAPRSEPSAGAVATPSVLPATEGIDAEGLRDYRLALAREARRYKRYPREAIEAGWVGTAQVQVAIRADGPPPAPRLVRSSGHDVLDAAALDMLRQAQPATSLPPTLRGRSFVVSLPVVFELPD